MARSGDGRTGGGQSRVVLAVDTAAATRSRSGRPPLGVAAPLAASVILLGWWLVAFARLLAAHGPYPSDLGEYWVAGQLTLHHGWAAPYDVALFRQALRAFGGSADAYASSPVATLAALALRPLPFPAAYAVWDGLLLAGVVAACRSATAARGWPWAAQLAGSLAMFEVGSALRQGQLAVALVGLLALHRWLERRGRPALAGVALGLAFVKPQDVFLVPVALALSGRRRPALAALATAAGLAALCALLLGPDGLRAYGRSIAFELGGGLAGRQALAWVLPAGAASVAVRAGIALVALVPAGIDRHRADRALAAAVLGSQLATPYLNGADLSLLAACAWLTLGDRAPWWLGWGALLSYVLVALPFPAYRTAAAAIEVGWLGALAAAAAAARYRNGRTSSVTSSSRRSAASRPSAGT
ncbi:MAG TPA: glycosyltransferase family 87 protein [Candidatus Dormibacteraeota bacterium]|nr:glycosyltransferase family 87 protein [Candidatus Dormibacteraeota bacterium]